MSQNKQKETIMLLLWVLALIATVGSLFYSEVLGYVPCELCWTQRIFMYPLVIIYGVALIKRDFSSALSGLFLSGIGFFISLYHYLVQKLPALQETGGTCQIIPCNLQYVNYFGFVTIPFLAGIAFLMITVLHISLLKLKQN